MRLIAIKKNESIDSPSYNTTHVVDFIGYPHIMNGPKSKCYNLSI